MQFDHILIRYGELSLKGKNRSKFTNQLQENVRDKLADFPQVKVKKSRHRMFVLLNGTKPEPVSQVLKDVFGIQSFSLAIRTESDIDEIKAGVLAAVEEAGEISTYKVTAKRADKNFPINSQELNQILGSHIGMNNEQLKVDVHTPDLNVKVEVRQGSTYITSFDQKGAGGLPVGTSGKTMLMLSGGIDSPVAAYFLMKRGVDIEAVHFHSPPFTSERAKQKVIDLMKKLEGYGGKLRLHIVPFTKIQERIHKQIPDSYSMTAMRRMMLKITEQLAGKHEALAIATGENLGQVASQTLQSMFTINEVTNYPVLRPLLTMDKNEIIDIAKQINTYEISIRPYEDCCTVFLPAAPKTRPKRDKINHFESFLNMDELVADTLEKVETIEFPSREKDEFLDIL